MNWLAQTRVILILFVVMFLTGAGFHWVTEASGGPLLDVLTDGEAAMVRLSQMDASQRTVHFRGTVFLDTLYPLAYGGFFAALIARFAGRWRGFLVVLPIATALADFSENITQAIALTGGDPEVLLAKDILTPLKFGFFLATFVTCVILLLIAGTRYVMARRTAKDV